MVLNINMAFSFGHLVVFGGKPENFVKIGKNCL